MDRPASIPLLGMASRHVVQPLRRHVHTYRVLLALVAAPPALLIAWSSGTLDSGPWERAALVGLSALIVVGATVYSAIRTRRDPDTRSALMTVAFTVMSVVLVARVAAMIPGQLYSPGLARITEVATLPLGALVLLLSVTPKLRQHRRVDTVAQSIPAVTVFMVAAFALVFTAADRIPAVPVPGSYSALLVFAVGAVLLLLLAGRAGRTAVLTERGSDVVVAAGLITAIFASWGIANAYRDDLLWWSAHSLELIGLAAMCIPATRDLARHTSSRPLVGDLRASDIVADEEAFLDGRVHHLMLQLGRKDDVTEGHTRRVATLAVRMGEQLGLDAASLRDLAAGGLLHDIGKLQTPDQILKKPGKLTDAEYEVIKRHPGEGARMLHEVGKFNERVLHLVEAHHERLDGGGYPNGAPAESIHVEARILAVADVFDALTSHRPYRVAWPADRALEVIERESGQGFDPRCVEALKAVLARQRLTPAGLQAAWRAHSGHL
ncbi:MAG: HD-GYP domain-containing protein, partial [Solirubrobacteraceae bacterium]|nr:HD-GYP domain-containing protein [Solirubrobacteraceae bacterium]